jgi:hypothetical protein
VFWGEVLLGKVFEIEKLMRVLGFEEIISCHRYGESGKL